MSKTVRVTVTQKGAFDESGKEYGVGDVINVKDTNDGKVPRWLTNKAELGERKLIVAEGEAVVDDQKPADDKKPDEKADKKA